mgnify:CR=1 FL=1
MRGGILMERKYGIGLDIGIGSCGWCIISWQLPDKSDARIEDLGVRLFDSGEITYEATAQKIERIRKGVIIGR